MKNLAEHLDLMIKIMDYCQSPQFANFFKAFDKKLTKNVLKRCVIDPFTERVMKKPISPDQKDEIEILAQDPQVIDQINEVLKKLISINAVLTNNLKDWLCSPLVKYINFLKGSHHLQVAEDILILEEFARKCQMLDEAFDYYNREQLQHLLKNKQPHQIERYIKILTGLVSQGISENKTVNKKYIKQVFDGEASTYFKLLKDNLSWLLEKYKYDFSEEQIVKLLDLLNENHQLIIKPNNPQLKIKLDTHLQRILAEQDPRFPKLKLCEKYGEMFFSRDEQAKNHE